MGTSASWGDGSGWRVRAGAASLVGNYRENNEDLVHLDRDRPFALVLDGMGGHAAGEVASRTGADALAAALRAGLAADADPGELLENSLRAANAAVLELGNSAPEFRNCGTTVVLALLHRGAVHVSWLGDSPAFRVSEGRIEKLTWEHDLRNALVRAGTLSAAEARAHLIRNLLWRYLGTREADGPLDVVSFVPRPGDRLLLLTDGVSGVVPDAELLALAQAHPDPRACAEELTAAALDRGSRDNCTAAVLAFEWSGDGPPPEPRQEVGELGGDEPRRARTDRPARRWWQFWK